MRSFIWAVDKTPEWFSKDYSYRMNPDTHELEVPTMEGNKVVMPGQRITEGRAGFFIIGEPTEHKPNRAERRHNRKHGDRMEVSAIIVQFKDGNSVQLDTNKVMIVDKDTRANLFDYVIEGS